MKLTLIALGVVTLAGCAPPPEPLSPPPVGGGPIARPPTDWPRGSDSPAPARAAYPFILAHGLDGFKNIGPISYFYGVADALGKDGHPVFVSQVDAYNSSEVRGAQLQKFVEGVLHDTGADKVNLICHSQGGLDCRYVASNLGDRVASVTTIAAPHHGTPIADIATGAVPGPASQAVAVFLNLLGATVDGLAGGTQMDQNAQAALETMTTKGALAFGALHPDHPGVAYYSVAGRSNGSSGDDACGSPTEAPFIGKYDHATDGIGPELAPSAAIISGSFNPAPSNDGLVPVGSARYGTFLGCLPSDHLGEMCHTANGQPGASYDCVQFYRDLADWLVTRGF